MPVQNAQVITMLNQRYQETLSKRSLWMRAGGLPQEIIFSEKLESWEEMCNAPGCPQVSILREMLLDNPGDRQTIQILTELQKEEMRQLCRTGELWGKLLTAEKPATKHLVRVLSLFPWTPGTEPFLLMMPGILTGEKQEAELVKSLSMAANIKEPMGPTPEDILWMMKAIPEILGIKDNKNLKAILESTALSPEKIKEIKTAELKSIADSYLELISLVWNDFDMELFLAAEHLLRESINHLPPQNPDNIDLSLIARDAICAIYIKCLQNVEDTSC